MSSEDIRQRCLEAAIAKFGPNEHQNRDWIHAVAVEIEQWVHAAPAWNERPREPEGEV